jgi:putative serine protease PepD
MENTMSENDPRYDAAYNRPQTQQQQAQQQSPPQPQPQYQTLPQLQQVQQQSQPQQPLPQQQPQQQGNQFYQQGYQQQAQQAQHQAPTQPQQQQASQPKHQAPAQHQAAPQPQQQQSAPPQQPYRPQPQPHNQPQATLPPQAHYQAQPPRQQQPYYQPQPQHQAAAGTRKPVKERPKGTRTPFFITAVMGVIVGALLVSIPLFVVTNGFKPSDPSTNLKVIAALGSASTPKTQIVTSGAGGDYITITPLSENASLAEVVAAKTLPSIVNIDVYKTAPGSSYDEDGGSTDNLEQYGLGSGVVITNDGYILTNYHVIEGGNEFLVRFNETTQFRAIVVGSDESSDLAVLKVEATDLIPIEVADSDAVAVGEWVMALGSPFGLEKSVSTGIVSARFRSTTMESANGSNFYANMIQTDAAINPGNSGGALVNGEGKLIGINTLISSASGSSSGIGFAIPSNYAMRIAETIMSGKEVEHAYLGVTLQTVDISNSGSFNTTAARGAFIEEVATGSPADLAGIKKGDVVVRFDNAPISTSAELQINIKGHLVGDKVTLTVVRGEETIPIEVTLDSNKNAG